MIAVNDINRIARFIVRGQPATGSDGFEYTREDVLPVLKELKQMLDRMFDRLEVRGINA